MCSDTYQWFFSSFSITENLHFIENVPTDILFSPWKLFFIVMLCAGAAVFQWCQFPAVLVSLYFRYSLLCGSK
jgi:hypothetical protein